MKSKFVDMAYEQTHKEIILKNLPALVEVIKNNCHLSFEEMIQAFRERPFYSIIPYETFRKIYDQV